MVDVIPQPPLTTPTAIDPSLYVSGLTLSLTVFILGSIFMLLLCALIVIFVFGRPMIVAGRASSMGRALVQHFDTPRSSQFKSAFISAGTFRYDSVADGTVCSPTGGVNTISSRTHVLTFADVGITIPVKILGAISSLFNSGIKSRLDLINYVTKKEFDEAGNLVASVRENKLVVDGYNFNDFKEILRQNKSHKMIPLCIEAIKPFMSRNLNAGITEKKITVQMMKDKQFMNRKLMQDAMVILVVFVSVIVLYLGMTH